MTRTIEGEITTYGLRIEYDVRRGGGGHDSADLHESWPDDEPEVTIVSVKIVDHPTWTSWLYDFDLPKDQDPKEFVTEHVIDDVESQILSNEGLS